MSASAVGSGDEEIGPANPSNPAASASEKEFESSIPSHNTVFKFLIPLLISLLQVKYQGKDASPFETHPAYMVTFFIATFIYCLGLRAKMTIHRTTYSQIANDVILISSGSLSSVSLGAIFLPRLLGRLIFIIWAFFAIMVGRHFFKTIYHWLRNGIQEVVLPAVRDLFNNFMDFIARQPNTRTLPV